MANAGFTGSDDEHCGYDTSYPVAAADRAGAGAARAGLTPSGAVTCTAAARTLIRPKRDQNRRLTALLRHVRREPDCARACYAATRRRASPRAVCLAATSVDSG